MDYYISPANGFSGTMTAPGDKSISHRALLLSAIAEGQSEIRGLLTGEDCLHTLSALQALGVEINSDHDHTAVQGVGLHGLCQTLDPLYLGNAGTAMRLLTGLLAGQSFSSTLIGDKSLSKRPMKRVTNPLSAMGAVIQTDNGCAPLVISACTGLQGITYQLPMASAQVKSAILLAGLYAKGETTVIEPVSTRDHTEKMLAAFAYPVDASDNRISLTGGGQLTATTVDIPGDFSSAAFFIVIALLSTDAHLIIENVGVNHSRTGLLRLLELMGANISLSNQRTWGAEPVADIEVRSSTLKGIDVPTDCIPSAIDEFPVFFIAAAKAKGTTVLKGAKELRVKESDRLHAMSQGLIKLGVSVEESQDGLIIEGGELSGGEVSSFADHRIAMAFSVAAMVAKDAILIKDCDNIHTSFPGFADLVREFGVNLRIIT